MKKVLVLIVILALGVSGCVNEKKIKVNGTRAKIISYMDEKYKEDFEYIDSIDGGFDKNRKEILISSKKIPNEEIEVSYVNDNGAETYKDNYIQLKYKKQTYELIKKLMSDIFGEDVIVTYEIIKSNNEFNNETSFEDFLKSNNSGVYFYAVVSPEYKIDNIENLETEVKEKIKSNFASCNVNIYFAGTEDEFKDIHDIPFREADKMKKINFAVVE